MKNFRRVAERIAGRFATPQSVVWGWMVADIQAALEAAFKGHYYDDQE